MRPQFALAFLACSNAAQASAVHQHFNQDDQGLFPEPKYFREVLWDQHYASRFSKEPLADDARHNALVGLVQSYLYTMNDLKVQTWLMHGTLLGWWWGKHIMPWDPDADFQVTEADMFFLASYYNMTTYRRWSDMFPEGREYLLEINPHFAHRDPDDQLNVIDARWIDMTTGLFVDITAARYALDHPKGKGVLFDKNGHEFRDTYLYPLRQTTFEGAPALIPYRYDAMLRSEYGDQALTRTTFMGHVFDKKEMRWIKEPKAKSEAG
ncbi:hypothetical protein NLU13_1226 [Sarocladium strictum]|uniref:LicD/FKTN/FKRP nucleotidyltransferase domain-containing protein n=1 Tax=Sarocladium strictum TaxID=5046 RepID=A0AA39LC22_SARSR|nr:hypothetical protein NLU13_1226 [Sarocladium strictum]